MARIPSIRRLTVEDFPDQKEWIGKLLQPLNQFMDEVAAGLNKNLEFGANIQAQIKVLEFQTRAVVADTFPLYFKYTLPKRPEGCFVAKAEENDAAPATLATAVWADWEVTQDNQIKIKNLTGLAVSQKYKVTLFVF